MKKHFFILALASALFACSESKTETIKSPEELRNELKNQEASDPLSYLSADGTYRENFWGNKVKIKCSIKNSATMAAFKDIVLRIRFYAKTGTEVGTEEQTIYEIIGPGSQKSVELSVNAYSNVSKLGWEVVSALPMDQSSSSITQGTQSGPSAEEKTMMEERAKFVQDSIATSIIQSAQ